MAPLQSFGGPGLSPLRRNKSLLSRPRKPLPIRELPRGAPHYFQPPPLLTRATKKQLPSDEPVKKKKRVRKRVNVDDSQTQELLKIAQLVPKEVRNQLLTHPELENVRSLTPYHSKSVTQRTVVAGSRDGSGKSPVRSFPW